MVNILLSQYRFHENWANETMKKYINKEHKIVIVPFSFSENVINNQLWGELYKKDTGKYYKETITPFLKLGCNENNITLINYFKDSKEKMKSIIKDSDIVFLTGGYTEKSFKRVVEKDLLKEIQESKVVIGVSAGALIQLKEYYLSEEEYIDDKFYFKGLSLVPDDFYIEVHYDNEDYQNEAIERVLKEKSKIVYAIKDNGGIIIDRGDITLIGEVIVFNN
ncbi:MAG: Type 1 glutamine amidotransferase-like domain-containing protein [Clostridium sp.]